MTTPTIEDAIALAVELHRGATDKGAEPYILHPLRVMLAQEGEVARMGAVLHDVCEDCGVTIEDLRARGYPARLLEVVDALTRRPKEPYQDFIQRLKPDPIARKIKLADLADNMRVTRLPTIDAAAAERLEKYRQAWLVLGGG